MLRVEVEAEEPQTGFSTQHEATGEEEHAHMGGVEALRASACSSASWEERWDNQENRREPEPPKISPDC